MEENTHRVRVEESRTEQSRTVQSRVDEIGRKGTQVNE